MDEKQKRILKYNPYVTIKEDKYWCTICDGRVRDTYHLPQTAKQATNSLKNGCFRWYHDRNLKIKSVCKYLESIGWIAKIWGNDYHPTIKCLKGHPVKIGTLLKLDEYKCPKC